jgi:hypothetical protein
LAWVQYASIAGAALPFAMRLGTGAVTHGYGIGLAKNDECAALPPSPTYIVLTPGRIVFELY